MSNGWSLEFVRVEHGPNQVNNLFVDVVERFTILDYDSGFLEQGRHEVGFDAVFLGDSAGKVDAKQDLKEKCTQSKHVGLWA